MTETRITYRGRRLNVRTRDMLLAAEKIAGRVYVITQGSYNNSVVASAGTHDGGGALDLRAIDLTPSQRNATVAALRMVGFAAWLRTPAEGKWPLHVHAIAVGDDDLSPGAAAQVRAYQAGFNGLANGEPDTGPAGFRGTTWEKYQANRQNSQDGFTVSEADRVIAFIQTTLASSGIEGQRFAQEINENRGQTKILQTAIEKQTLAIEALTRTVQAMLDEH